MTIEPPGEDAQPLTPIQALRSGLAWIRGTDDASTELTPDVS